MTLPTSSTCWIWKGLTFSYNNKLKLNTNTNSFITIVINYLTTAISQRCQIWSDFRFLELRQLSTWAQKVLKPAARHGHIWHLSIRHNTVALKLAPYVRETLNASKGSSRKSDNYCLEDERYWRDFAVLLHNQQLDTKFADATKRGWNKPLNQTDEYRF
jgi:hypothetical protein